MSGTILLRGARQLLTLRGSPGPRRGPEIRDLGIIRDGALLIRDGRILEVGLSRRIENLASADITQEIDATGQIVLPGFVDCHSQLVWASPSSADHDIQITASGEAPPYAPVTTEQVLRSASVKRLESRTRQLISGMLRHGTTTVDAKSGWGLDPKSELKILRVQDKLNHTPLDITSTFLVPDLVPPAYAADPGRYLASAATALLEAISEKTHARFAGLRYSGYVFTHDQSRRYLQAAGALGFQLKVDAAGDRVSDVVRLAIEVDAIAVDNLAHAGAAEVDLLAHSGTAAVLLPGAGFRNSAGRHIPARQLIDSGAIVALGSGYDPAASSTYSMPTVIALACAHLGMTPAEAICAATYNAAWAVGRAHVAGSLEAGKSADLVVLNAPDYREIPYHFGVNLVHRTVKGGVTVYQEPRNGR